MRIRKELGAVVVGLSAIGLGACSTPVQYYADAGHNSVYYSEIRKTMPVTTMRVELAFYNNGKLQPSAEPALRDQVYRVLTKLGTVTVSSDPSTQNLLIVEVHDSYGESTESRTKMFMSGATFGRISAEANTDHYEFTITYREASGAERFGRYKHSIWVTSGNHPPTPSDRGPYSAGDAVGIVIEDVLLQFFKDLENTGDDTDSVIFVPTPAPRGPDAPAPAPTTPTAPTP